MRVLILANYDLGLFKFRKELIDELIRKGNEVYISLPEGRMIKNLEEIGCKFIRTEVDRRGINPIKDIKLLITYKKIINQIRPELIITYTIKPNIYGGIAARLTKTIYAVNITGLGTAFERAGIIRTIVVILYRTALKNAKVIFVENVEIAKTIESYHLKDRSKESQICILNGAGVNTNEYYNQAYPENKVPRFLFVGRVMKEKGISELLAATHSLIQEGNNCFLDIVGPYEEDYRNVMEQAESEGWLKYHGYHDDVRPFIGACDCFVLPSYHEGMANTNLECASSGRPVITSNIPGCKEAIIDGQTGFLCEPKNVESLYETMKRMLSLTRSERAEMGEKGRSHMITTFEKTTVVKKTLEQLFN